MRRLAAVVGAIAVMAWVFGPVAATRAATPPVSPSSPTLSYDHGPFTNLNLGGLAVGSCTQPSGCDNTDIQVDIPAGYYEGLRAQGKVGVVQVALSWVDNANDFDLGLLNASGAAIASSGFGNSDFERINFTELPTGKYTVQVVIFRAANTSFHVDVRLLSMTPSTAAVTSGTGGMAFSNGTPVALERSSGEPDMGIAPNGDMYIDMPLGAGTNSILYKSKDNGTTWLPLAPLHPNNNPLPNNLAGGGDALVAIDPAGRICFSELNTLISLGIGCSTDGGKTFVPADPLVLDPSTPLVDRQWQAATPQKEQFISAEFGIVSVGPSQPGIRLYKEVAGSTNFFTKVQDIDTGKSMKSYNMAVDPTDTDANGGTVVEAYLRSNQDPVTKAASPHQLMVWQTTDGGTTVTTHKVADLATTPGNNFASVDVDRAGNTYVAWSEQGTWDIFYSVAKKGDLDHWSTPVRVNADPAGRTAIQPTIKVGDAGRVFVGYYAAPQWGNPDALPGGVWDAFLSYSTNGACQLDAVPCGAPTFRQVKITDHPAQYRGICLGGTACSDADAYYGDRSMLEFLDIEFTPATGQVHVITTDSSRESRDTTITTYRQIGGPSAFAGQPDIGGSDGVASGVTDPQGDGGWPYESALPTQAAPGADLLGVSLSRPDSATLEVTMKVANAGALAQALQAGVGQELLIGTRFATSLDVFWVGLEQKANEASPRFLAGHLVGGLLADGYVSDATGANAKGRIDPATNSIVIDVPIADFKTALDAPGKVAKKVVPGFANGDALYGVTGFSLVGLTSAQDSVAKHWLDVAPSFTFSGAVNTSNVAPAGAPGSGGAGGKGSGNLPATGGVHTGLWGGAVLVLAAAVAAVRRRARHP
jgi:hypothetical protein